MLYLQSLLLKIHNSDGIASGIENVAKDLPPAMTLMTNGATTAPFFFSADAVVSW